MDDNREDLKLARRLGYFLRQAREMAGGVRIEGTVLLYDPCLPPSRRAQLVCQAIRFDVPRFPPRA
jgi:hypothetical protein